MNARLRQGLDRMRRRALSPVLIELEDIDGRLNSRLDHLEIIIQTLQARVGTLSEEAITLTESQVKLAHRVDQIEQSLGGAGDR